MTMLRLSKSSIGFQEIKAVQTILEKEFLGTGPETHAFEKKIEGYLGGKNVAHSDSTKKNN